MVSEIWYLLRDITAIAAIQVELCLAPSARMLANTSQCMEMYNNNNQMSI